MIRAAASALVGSVFFVCGPGDIRAAEATPKAPAARPAGKAAGAKPIALDRFLENFEKGCAGAEALGSYQFSQLVRGDTEWSLGDAPEIPKPVAPAFGTPQLTTAENGNLGIVTVPLTGATYRGLKVRIFRFAGAREHGLIDDALVFDEPEAKVRKALAPVIAKSKKRMGEEGIGDIRVEVEDGEVRLRCYAAE